MINLRGANWTTTTNLLNSEVRKQHESQQTLTLHDVHDRSDVPLFYDGAAPFILRRVHMLDNLLDVLGWQVLHELVALNGSNQQLFCSAVDDNDDVNGDDDDEVMKLNLKIIIAKHLLIMQMPQTWCLTMCVQSHEQSKFKMHEEWKWKLHWNWIKIKNTNVAAVDMQIATHKHNSGSWH